jgi:hypothetical protein
MSDKVKTINNHLFWPQKGLRGFQWGIRVRLSHLNWNKELIKRDFGSWSHLSCSIRSWVTPRWEASSNYVKVVQSFGFACYLSVVPVRETNRLSETCAHHCLTGENLCEARYAWAIWRSEMSWYIIHIISQVNRKTVRGFMRAIFSLKDL